MVRSQTACGLFVPESFEMRFAHMQDIILADGDGRKISMTGKIDRIDTCQSENDKLLFRIIDYKSGIKETLTIGRVLERNFSCRYTLMKL